MRAKIDAWSRSKRSAKGAEQLAAMDERIDTVEHAVQEDLVEAVFERMEQAFDRRFEVLVQLVEARIRDVVSKREEPAKRRFLRGSEED